MVAAMKAVAEGNSNVNKAAIVPRTTLQDRSSGRVIHGINPVPRPHLEKTEETELAEFLQTKAEVGF